MDADRSVTLFISYAHADEKQKLQLEKHLKPLRLNGLIEKWSDHQIEPGQDWAHQIDLNLKTADIILLLVSPDFISSDYCTGVELNEAMRRCQNGEAIVVPVILKACKWEMMSFGKLQAVPKEGKAIETWDIENEAFKEVTTRIGKLAEDLLDQRKERQAAKREAVARYKTKVEQMLSDGEITPLERKTLNELREQLGLTAEEAETIKDTAYKPLREYQNKLAQYRIDLAETIDLAYPLSEATKLDLKQRQRELGLKAEDAERLDVELLDAAEIRHRAQQMAGETATQRARAQAEQRALEATLRKAQEEADRRARDAEEQARSAAALALRARELAAEEARQRVAEQEREAAELEARRETERAERAERRLADDERRRQAAARQGQLQAEPQLRPPADAGASRPAKPQDPPVYRAPAPAVAAPVAASVTIGDRLLAAGIGAVVVAVVAGLPALVVDMPDAGAFTGGSAIFGAIMGGISASYRWIAGLAVFMFLAAVFGSP